MQNILNPIRTQLAYTAMHVPLAGSSLKGSSLLFPFSQSVMAPEGRTIPKCWNRTDEKDNQEIIL